MVSIHALLAECDSSSRNDSGMPTVSIHALLAECDLTLAITDRVHKGFNPRTPCGVRLKFDVNELTQGQFQSTHSLRSATV